MFRRIDLTRRVAVFSDSDRISAVMNATFSLGGIIGPYVIGMLRKSSGGNKAPLIASTLFSATSFILFNLLHVPTVIARLRGRRKLKRKTSDLDAVIDPA